MKFFSALILIIILAVASIAPFIRWANETYPEQASHSVATSWQEVLNYAQENLPKTGQLIVKSDGFGYLKVDDAYINTLFPMLKLKEEGFRKPPYFRRHEAPGAHISVFYADENIRPTEAGQYFSFELKRIVIVKTSKDTSYVILEVDSPELEALREKYGLSPKLFGHEYHISLAKKTLHPRSRR